jgi:CDP-diacylglycerol---serine O-phosphatidyltransferase
MAPADRPRRGIPLRALAPNAVTAMALATGLTGVRFAIAGKWELAAAAIVLAGILDGLDGRLARLLKGATKFGAELDSLSDVIAFGVAPALVIYLWSLQHLQGFGWVVSAAFAVCCALRLARFNAQLDAEETPYKKLGFLTGIPSPVAAGLALSPLFFDLWLEADFFRTPALCAAMVAAVALMMVANLPTYSWKSLRIRRSWRLPLVLLVTLYIASLLNAPWGTLSLTSIAYLISLPLAWRSYQKARAKAALAEATPTVSPAPAQ